MLRASSIVILDDCAGPRKLGARLRCTMKILTHDLEARIRVVCQGYLGGDLLSELLRECPQADPMGWNTIVGQLLRRDASVDRY